MSSAPATIGGFLVVDKPLGWTSADVVRKLKSAFGLRQLGVKIGHCGTLDPAATGVLPICIGPATRFAQFVTDSLKTYTATVTFGVATDSYDADGEVVATADAGHVTEEMVAAALATYVGDVEQVPPRYSAIKRDGVRMYTVARAGGAPEMTSRQVHVSSIDVTGWSPPDATLEVACGKGFYVRSLAHDVGEALGCGAHLSGLRRTRVGAFADDAAVRLDDLLEAGDAGAWQRHLVPIDAPLQHIPSHELDSESAVAFMHGRPVVVSGATEPGWMRIYDEDGCFLGMALADPRSGIGKPAIVLPQR